MSSLSPDYVVPEATIAKVRPLWEAALDDATPFVGKLIDIHVPLVRKNESRWRTVQELFGGLGDAFGAIHNVAVPRAVILHQRDFVDMRKLGRDVLDIGDGVLLWPLGVQARLWGTLVITNALRPWLEKHGRSTWVKPRTLFVVGQKSDESWVRQEIRVTREPFPGSGT